VKVEVVDYDADWPAQFSRIAARLRELLGPLVLSLDHVGLTAVPGLAAKPVIDINMVIEDTRVEETYAPQLERVGYRLAVREPEWFEHRMFRGSQPASNLHVFPRGCPEVERMRLFRDWLRHDFGDVSLYANTKRRLAERTWDSVQDYADAKQDVIEQMMKRARAWAASTASQADRQS
jgi:GrpB-like predicted nucleotidyltransferase (UPF0157 family)